MDVSAWGEQGKCEREKNPYLPYQELINITQNSKIK